MPSARLTSRTWAPARQRPASIGAALKRLFAYLAEIRVYEPVKPRPVQNPYSWLLEPYLQYLQEDCQLSEITLKRARVQVSAFLESLQQRARRNRFKALRAEALEGLLKLYFKNSQENLASLSGTLRRFFGYCASHHHTAVDFSGLVPTPTLSACRVAQRPGRLGLGPRARHDRQG